MKYDLLTRRVAGTPHVVHILMYEGVEVRRQLSAFDEDEIQGYLRRHKAGKATAFGSLDACAWPGEA